MKTAVILAAGRGTRLRPVTDRRSKAMAPVLGRPLVDLAVETLTANGVEELIFVVNASEQELQCHFSARKDIRTRFVVQAEQLGMAHALRMAAPMIEGPFLLSACDSFCTPEHVADLMAAASGREAALSLLEVEESLVCRSAAVELDGDRVRRIVEKPGPGETDSRTVSLPLYAFSFGFLSRLNAVTLSPRGEFELQDAIASAIVDDQEVVGVLAEARRQVSSPQDLLDLNMTVMDHSGGDEERPEKAGAGSTFVSPFIVDDGVAIGDNCRIGPRVYLERGAVVSTGVSISNSIVQRDAVVPAGATITNQIV